MSKISERHVPKDITFRDRVDGGQVGESRGGVGEWTGDVLDPVDLPLDTEGL